METKTRRRLMFPLLSSLIAAALSLGASTAMADPPPVVAVFLMESRGSPLAGDELTNLTDYLSTMLGAGGKMQIIPRDEISKRLGQVKTDSHKACYDSSCQIELGRELAAHYSISPKIGRVGRQCLITAQVYDLKTSTMIAAVPGRALCKADALIEAVDHIAAKLTEAIADGKKDVEAYDGISGGEPVHQPAEKPKMVARFTGSLRSENLALAQNVYGTSDTVKVKYFNTTGKNSDWICVVPAGTKDDNAGGRYDYLGGKDGAFSVTNLPEGEWQARLYLNYDTVGYKVADRLTFHVGGAAPAAPIKTAPIKTAVAPRAGGALTSKHLSLAKRSYSRQEEIVVQYFGTTGSRYDWINVVPADSKDDHAGERYDYLTAKDGSFKVSDLPKGDWEARLYLDYSKKGYVVSDRIRFSVR